MTQKAPQLIWIEICLSHIKACCTSMMAHIEEVTPEHLKKIEDIGDEVLELQTEVVWGKKPTKKQRDENSALLEQEIDVEVTT